MPETVKCGVVIVAAGAGRRAGGVPKALIPFRGGTLLSAAVRTALSVEGVVAVAVACVPGMRQRFAEAAGGGDGRVVFVDGGAERCDSVEAAVGALPDDIGLILIHDVARPWATADLFNKVAAGALDYGAAIPVVEPSDTVKVCAGGVITGTQDRKLLGLAQTPQGFSAELFRAALSAWRRDGRPPVTDDASLVERTGAAVRAVEGERGNTKVTWPEDVKAAMGQREDGGSMALMRTGYGWDLHRTAPGRQLVLGGVRFDCGFGLAGHSDADVLAHAVADALLGAAALGDIGTHFPDTDPAWKGADSMALLGVVADRLAGAGYRVLNVDCTVVAERPRISPRAREIAEKIAAVLGIDRSMVGVKAKTAEGLGAEGEGLAISAHAVALIEPD